MKITRLVLAAALFGGAAMTVQAQNTKPDAPATTRPARNEARTSALRGELISVNVETGELKLAAKQKKETKEVTVQTSKDTTVVKLDGAAASIADLKPGMHVIITPATGVATEVKATSPAAKKQPKANGRHAGEKNTAK